MMHVLHSFLDPKIAMSVCWIKVLYLFKLKTCINVKFLERFVMESQISSDMRRCQGSSLVDSDFFFFFALFCFFRANIITKAF